MHKLWMDRFAIEIESPIQRQGKTTKLYKARDVLRRIKLAIKEVEIKDPDGDHRERAILEHLRGCPNIINLLGSVRVEHEARIFLTFDYVESTSWWNIQNSLSNDDLQNYMCQLFSALSACHERGIIHRNIKPENLLINHGRRQLQLTGWSQAVYHHSQENYPLEVSTYEYMSPELLMNGPNNGFSVDLWSAGCILAASVFRQGELFSGSSRVEQLLKIVKILGSKDLESYIQAYNIKVVPQCLQVLSSFQGAQWEDLVSSANHNVATDEALDLISQLLVIDPFKRSSAKQALSHPYLRWHRERGYQTKFNEADIPWAYFDCTFARFIGEGTYGKVYKVTNNTDGKELAVKIMKRGRGDAMLNEIYVMEQLQGAPNVIKYFGCIKSICSGLGILVFEYVQFTEWRCLYKSLKSTDIQYYIYQLLLALDACHSFGFMHRDVKPSNMVIDPTSRNLRLIDWGQAIRYQKGKEYSVDVGTRQYKSPELLLGHQQYDFAIDMWPVGCILASAVFRKRHLFPSENNNGMLNQITSLVGSEAMLACFKRYNKNTLPTDHNFENIERREWSSFITKSNKRVATKKAVDLVSKLLVCEPEKRLTAKQALEHSYFKKVSRLLLK